MSSRFVLARTLLFGVALMAVCGGMQGTLLGIRAALEGFSLDAIGLIMSAYYIGILLGAWLAPLSVRQVGHIRVFAAVASMASVTILLHSIFVDPVWWFGLRLLTGFCFSGLYLVAESWLNAISTNANRGQLLSAYMFTVALGFIGGQFAVDFWPPSGFEPFIFASAAVSLAMIPMLLSAIAAPMIDFSENLHLLRFIRITPLGSAAVFIHGMTFGALIWMTAVFGRELGFSVPESSLLVVMLMAGGLALMLPVGKLSDMQDRRRTLLLLAFATGLSCLAVPLAVHLGGIWVLACTLFVVGGVNQPMYSVSTSLINDHLDSRQILSASGAIILISGFGGLSGPLLAARAMSVFGAESLYLFAGCANVALALFTLYRMLVRPPIPAADQSDPTVVVMQTSQMVLANAMDEADSGDPAAPPPTPWTPTPPDKAP